MLLDQWLHESDGDAIGLERPIRGGALLGGPHPPLPVQPRSLRAPLPPDPGTEVRVRRTGWRSLAAWVVGLSLALCAVPTISTRHAVAQHVDDAETRAAGFKRDWPALYDQLVNLERANAVFFGALVKARKNVKEAEVYRELNARVTETAGPQSEDVEARKGYEALGSRAAELIRRTHAFHREVLAIFASVELDGREQALDAAVDRYLSQAEVSLPDVPKDMNILYDHPYTSFVVENFTPKRKQTYPSLTGFVWASHWFQLAVQEPLEVGADREERAKGVAIVTDRFRRKLSGGKPPDAFPTELPLAPSIAPGLVSAHLRSAAILDNLNMMQDVLADVLVHPNVPNLRTAIDDVIRQFTDRSERVVEVDDWITMALRHSIFAQGGPALRTMTQSDRNGSGHVQHARGSRSIPPGGMR